ncbi:hypothetical protein CRUP_018153, partial [Coryphaenoides rupestris]
MTEQASKHDPQTPRAPACQAKARQTALHRAATVGNSDAMAALVQGGCAVDLQERAGNTPLHLACQNAHAQSARVLLLGGSVADAKNNTGDTCLHVAARYNNQNVLKTLLSALCSVTERNQEGDTALHVAAALNHKKSVQLLLEAGADPNVQNNAGRTALDKARDNNNKEVAVVIARAPEDSVSPAEDDKPDTEQRDPRAAIFTSGRHCYRQHRRKLAAVTGRSPRSRRHRAMDEDHAGGGGVDLPEIQRRRKGCLLSGDSRKPQRTASYQLYTLYRDREGVAPASGCHCRPLFRKLEGQIHATQEEMKSHMLSLQDQVNVQLGRMQRRNRHQ